MAAIVFDTAVIHFRGDSSAKRLNFPDNVSHIKNRLEGCSHTEPVQKIRCVARKAAKVIAPLISLENKDEGLEVSENKDQALEVTAAISAATSSATSALMISSNTGIISIDQI